MRKFLGRVLVVLSLGAAAAAASAAGCGSAEVEAARPSEARAAVARGALLLDVRTPEEFQGGHVEGATNIPVQVLAERAGEITAGREVVVYCKSGRRSAAAAELLRGRGHKVIDIGPMTAW